MSIFFLPFSCRLLYLPGAVIVGVLGFMIDMPMISLIALYKSPYMLFRGWHRLFQDLIGREGPFLETICVPFAGLAIILWPLAVAGAVLGSIVSGIFLGAYAGVVVYQVKKIIIKDFLLPVVISFSFMFSHPCKEGYREKHLKFRERSSQSQQCL